MNVILFSNNCQRCFILKQKLEQANIPFIESNDFSEIIELGFLSAPMLKVENHYFPYESACIWVQEQNV